MIHRTLSRKWDRQSVSAAQRQVMWNQYVPKHLLPRLHGYELMMAPYTIAHMKIGLKLRETNFTAWERLGPNERVRIYLTNALEGPLDFSGMLAFAIPALAHEAKAVDVIKRKQRFTVVVGNPPYSGVSMNMSARAQLLIEAYKFVDGKPLAERKHWLQDDYVKFIRLAQVLLNTARVGILGLVTNHSYLDNTTFRGMRQSLLASFSTLHAYNLHGSAKKVNTASQEEADQNVFDIQQGVAIVLATAGLSSSPSVHYAELFGSRTQKYAALKNTSTASLSETEIVPISPYYFFVPRDSGLDGEYADYWALPDAMPVYVCGITTARDAFVIDFDDAEIVKRMELFLDERLSDTEVQKQLGLSENYAWRVADARERLRASGNWKKQLTNILYRPFDLRRIIYNAAVVWRTRKNVMGTFANERNLGLCTNRQVNFAFQHVGVTRWLINDCTLSLATKERTYVFPLWIEADKTQGNLLGAQERYLNFSKGFLRALSNSLSASPAGRSEALLEGLSGEDILAYVYSVLNCPSYRRRYAEQLRLAYPRIPIISGTTAFLELSLQLGKELIALHLMESPKVENFVTALAGPGEFQVEKVSYNNETVWIDRAKTQGFKGVPEEVWNFHMGGYQVCEKWLKDRQAKGGKNPRPGRVLTAKDIDHYQKIVVALSETIRIMAEIDEVVEQHGGWPDAFSTALDDKPEEQSSLPFA